MADAGKDVLQDGSQDVSPDHDLPRAVLELHVRRLAFKNMAAVLGERAWTSRGRFTVERLGDDAFDFRFPGVRTLVRVDGTLSLAERSFSVIVVAPPRWPLDRDEALDAFIVLPCDWAHPNASGSALCLDLDGVLPQELPQLLYACLTLRQARPDDCTDLAAAFWARTHPDEMPTDPRPLFPANP